MNFNITEKMIKSLITSYATYTNGYNLYRQNQVEDVNIEKKDGEVYVKAKVSGTDVTLKFVSNEFRGYYCSHEDCVKEIGVCQHLAALMIYLTKSEKDKRLVTRQVENFAKEIKSLYEKNSYLTNFVEEKVHLETIIDIQNNVYNSGAKIYLEVKLCKNKKCYIIKEIGKLVEDIYSCNTVKYGKSIEFKHNINTFDENSKKLVKLLKDEIKSRKNGREQR